MTASTRTSWTTIRDRIHGMILDGTYAPGVKMPRDEDLALELGCSRATVHRAMSSLAESGMLDRRRKGGTTVKLRPVTRATLDIPVIREEIEVSGARYGYQLVRQSHEPAPRWVTGNFRQAASQPMLKVEALHLADNKPYMYEDRWISLSTVPEIQEVDLSVHNANEWLLLNRPYSRCDLRLFARKSSSDDAAILEIAEGEALMVIERTTWIGDAPITSVRSVTAPGYQLNTQI